MAARYKIAAAITAVAIAVIAVWRMTVRESSEGSNVPAVTPPAGRTSPDRPVASRKAPSHPPVAAGQVVEDLVREDIEKAVVLYSPEALPTFERFLASNEPDVREAARDGLVRLGETGGAVLLRRATARMTDPEEIKRMEETAAWLELPSASEGPLRKK